MTVPPDSNAVYYGRIGWPPPSFSSFIVDRSPFIIMIMNVMPFVFDWPLCQTILKTKDERFLGSDKRKKRVATLGFRSILPN